MWPEIHNKMEQQRENKTIQEMAKVLMDEADIPHIFWGEATQVVMHLSNRMKLRHNSDKNPYELWKGRPTLVKHLKVFAKK